MYGDLTCVVCIMTSLPGGSFPRSAAVWKDSVTELCMGCVYKRARVEKEGLWRVEFHLIESPEQASTCPHIGPSLSQSS